MADYLKRTGELLLVTFLGGALPVFIAGGLSKGALAGAASAGVAAVYALLAKKVGDTSRPTVTK